MKEPSVSKELMKPRKELPETALIPKSGALIAWEEVEAEDGKNETAVSSSDFSAGLSCVKVKKEYILDVIDRKTGKVVQTETRKNEQAFDRLWGQAMANVNSLTYKLKAR